MGKKNMSKEQKEFVHEAYFPLARLKQPRMSRMVSRQAEWDKFKGKLSCKNPETEAFFEPGKGELNKARKAKKLCSVCPLLFVCGEQELLDPSDFGIKSAMTDAERKDLRSAIGGGLLNAVATLGTQSPERQLFLEITNVVLGVVALKDMTIPEANEEIVIIHERALQTTGS